MFNKRALDQEKLQEVALDKRLKHDLTDLFLSNSISAERSARLAENAALAGAQHLESLQVDRTGKNASRDLLRKAFKNSKWPSPYVFEVKCYDPAQNVVERKEMSMLLPHELLHSILMVNDASSLLRRQRSAIACRPDLQAHLEKLHGMGFANAQDILLLSIWADAVPFNSDRTMSLETITMGIIGQGSLRLPLACFPKAFCKKQMTYEDCFSVIVWSCQHLLANRFPLTRHDQTEFQTATDAYRKKRAGIEIGIRAALGEMKADWALYKETLDFPSRSATGSICWLCSCHRDDLKQFDTNSLARLLG